MKFVYILDLVFIATVFLHIWAVPYSKVEESFNIQAIHDIVNYGVQPDQLENYDHKSFPGPVPRTFVGSMLIAGAVKAIDFGYTLVKGTPLVVKEGDSQIIVQLVARGVLGLANIAGFIALRNSLSKVAFVEKNAKSKGAVGFFYTLFLMVQFHVPYYCSRTLPNFIALPFVLFALAKLVEGNMAGLTWLAFTAVIFRVEIGVLAVTFSFVSSLVFGQSDIQVNLYFLIVGTVVGVLVTLLVDSYFWGEWVWPELESFKFNVIAGNASAWGVEPYGAYFTRYLPNFFQPPHVLLLSVLGLLVDPANDGTPTQITADNKVVITHPARNSLRILTFSAILYIAFMSKQPHKEWRFIVYTVPIFTLLAANGLASTLRKWSSLFAHKLLLFVMLASTGLSVIFTFLMTYASSFNYPGGEAITFLNDYIINSKANENVLVHMDVASCMSGITKCTELHSPHAVFDKTEGIEELSRLWNNITHIITEVDADKPHREETLIKIEPSHWKKLKTVNIFTRVNFFPILHTFDHIRQFQALPAEVSPAGTPGPWEYKDKLAKFLRTTIQTRSYLYIYERTQPDAIPVYLDLEDSEPEKVADEALQPPPVDADAVIDAINEEIDSFEDAHETPQ